MMPHSHGFLHHLAHDFDRALEIEAFTGRIFSSKAMAFNCSWLCTDKSVPLGRVLADQAVDVFVAAALPGLCGSQK